MNPSAEEDTDMEDDEYQDEPTTKYFKWSSCRYVRAVFEMVQSHCIITVAAQEDQLKVGIQDHFSLLSSNW